MKADRFKVFTGWAMAVLWRIFAPANVPRCEEHGVRLRRMQSWPGSYRTEVLCPVCNRRNVRMKAYPFSFYISKSGLVWASVILALGAATVWGVVPGVQTLCRWSAEGESASTAIVDTMPTEWASRYRSLEQISSNDRGEAFMEFATGSRSKSLEDRSPIIQSMPTLNPDASGLFMALFDSYDADHVLPVMMSLMLEQSVP